MALDNGSVVHIAYDGGICFSVKGQGFQAVHFNMILRTRLREVHTSYCAKLQLNPSEIVFWLNGKRILSDMIPKDGMKPGGDDEEIFDVFECDHFKAVKGILVIEATPSMASSSRLDSPDIRSFFVARA